MKITWVSSVRGRRSRREREREMQRIRWRDETKEDMDMGLAEEDSFHGNGWRRWIKAT